MYYYYVRASCHPTSLTSFVRSNVESFTDVAVHCANGVFYLHRLVLSSASSFLRQLLLDCCSTRSDGCSGGDQPTLVLPGVDQNCFRHLLDFIYTGETKIDQESVKGVLDLAKALQIKGVVGKRADRRRSCYESFEESGYSATNNPPPTVVPSSKEYATKQGDCLVIPNHLVPPYPTAAPLFPNMFFAPELLPALPSSASSPQPPHRRGDGTFWDREKKSLVPGSPPNLLHSVEKAATSGFIGDASIYSNAQTASAVQDAFPQPMNYPPEAPSPSSFSVGGYTYSVTCKVFTCSFCGKGFPRQQSMRRHEKTMHLKRSSPFNEGCVQQQQQQSSTTAMPNFDCLEVYKQFVQFEQQQQQAVVGGCKDNSGVVGHVGHPSQEGAATLGQAAAAQMQQQQRRELNSATLGNDEPFNFQTLTYNTFPILYNPM